MRVLDFGPGRGAPVTAFGSHGATALALGEGRGEGHVSCVRVEPGGAIGSHRAGFGQLFLVVDGSGWVSGSGGARVAVGAGQGAYIARGEVHAKGSEGGMTAIMVQLTELEPVSP